MEKFAANSGDNRSTHELRADELAELKLRTLRSEITKTLTEAGITAADADADWIICHVLSLSRGALQLPSTLDSVVAAAYVQQIRGYVAERATRKPLQYVLGTAAFRRLELHVGEGVFVPRPETEWVTKLGIDALQKQKNAGRLIATAAAETSQPPLVLELCTGSAAIALSLATETDSLVWAYEKSVAAAKWAAKNIAKYPTGRLQLVRDDILNLKTAPSLTELRGVKPVPGSIDLLIANPPYVPSGEIPEQPEVRDYDPEMALYSGSDGLELIREIAVIAARWLRPGGSVVLEHTEQQGSAVCDILRQAGLIAPRTHRDLTGRDRATTAHRAAD